MKLIKLPVDFDNVAVPLGGAKLRTRDGVFWLFKVGDFKLKLEPFFSPAFEGYKVGSNCVISHEEFSKVVNRILGRPLSRDQCIVWENLEERFENPQETKEAIRRLITRETGRVELLDINELIKEFGLACPDGPSMPQVCHLAALAWLGDFNKLTDYQNIFGRGHRMNFVPMITKEMIDRALEISYDRV